MRYGKTFLSGYRSIGVILFASAALMGASSLSAGASTFENVDAQTNSGDMVLGFSSSGTSYDTGLQQWTIALQASNTGSQTYNDVNFVAQFVWDSSDPSDEIPLLWNNSLQKWMNTTDIFAISSYAIGAGPSTAPVLFPLSDANTPLTWSRTGNSATVLSSDSLPAIPLGNFGPGATETFTLTCPSNSFNPDMVGFFVAVPEPSTFMLAVVGAVGCWATCVWRRKRAA